MITWFSVVALAVVGFDAPPPMLPVQEHLACLTEATPDALAGRASPLDSVTFRVNGALTRVCYGRPSARGRTMIGGQPVPFGRLWRTGANEPTILRTPVALSIAGVRVEPGTYAIYSVPNEDEWEIIVNRSYTQWGHEGRYTDEVAAQEVGRGRAQVERTEEHVETFTVRHDGSDLLFEWERTRVRIPIAATT